MKPTNMLFYGMVRRLAPDSISFFVLVTNSYNPVISITHRTIAYKPDYTTTTAEQRYPGEQECK